MNTLSVQYKVPGVYSFFDLVSQAAGFVPVGDKVILLAQHTSAGLCTSNVPEQIFDIPTCRTRFGSHSMAYQVARAFLRANPKANVWVMPIADPGAGVATIETITITVGTIVDGAYTLYIGAEKIEIAIVAADTPTTIATRLAAAINANLEQPFTATSAIGVVTITCVNKGLHSTYVRIENTVFPSGVTTVIATTTPGSGAADLDAVSGILAILYPADYTIYVNPYLDVGASSNMSAMKTHIDDLSDGDEQRGCIQVFGYTDKVDNLAAFNSLTSTYNHYRTFGFYLSGIRSTYYELGAACAAVICTQPRPGDTIDDYIVPGIDVPEVVDRLLETQKNAIILNGGSPLHSLNEQAAIVMARSTYISNAGGGYVDKLTDLTVPRALDWLRIQINNMERNNYKNAKNSATTRENLQDSVYAVLKKAETEEFEVTQNVDANRDGIVATPSSSVAGRCNVDIPADIVPGLHQIVNTIRLI
jgi:phage tail sheath gpL-like